MVGLDDEQILAFEVLAAGREEVPLPVDRAGGEALDLLDHVADASVLAAGRRHVDLLAEGGERAPEVDGARLLGLGLGDDVGEQQPRHAAVGDASRDPRVQVARPVLEAGADRESVLAVVRGVVLREQLHGAASAVGNDDRLAVAVDLVDLSVREHRLDERGGVHPDGPGLARRLAQDARELLDSVSLPGGRPGGGGCAGMVRVMKAHSDLGVFALHLVGLRSPVAA